MSAYMIDRKHVQYLVTVAMSRRILGQSHCIRWFHNGQWHELGCSDRKRAAEVAQMLWDENFASINARYPDTIEHPEGSPGVISEAEAGFVYGEHRDLFLHNIEPAQVLKACDCLEYQSCEHDGWETSEAHAFLVSLRSSAWRRVPGYEDAEWGGPKLATA